MIIVDPKANDMRQLALAIGELQLAVASMQEQHEAMRDARDELFTRYHAGRVALQNIRAALLEASHHDCDTRPACPRCGIRYDHGGRVVTTGWRIGLCSECTEDCSEFLDRISTIEGVRR